MRKIISSKDYRTWGIAHLVPEDGLKRIASTRFLYVPYVYKQAKAHAERVLEIYSLRPKKAVHPITYKESQAALLQEALSKLDPDPAMDDPFAMALILEYAFAVTIIDEYLQTQPGLRVELKRPSEKIKKRAESRTGSATNRRVVTAKGLHIKR